MAYVPFFSRNLCLFISSRMLIVHAGTFKHMSLGKSQIESELMPENLFDIYLIFPLLLCLLGKQFDMH